MRLIESKPIAPWIALAAAALLGIGAAGGGELYAYYTRLAYADASEVALPGRFLTGKYADVVVQLPAGRLAFSREHSYLPYWEVAGSQWLVPQIVPRNGDGPSARPDNINRCSYVRIIENTSNAVVVHWRYAPDLTTNHFTDFKGSYDGSLAKYYLDYVDEYFTIHADGSVVRTVRKGQAKVDVYNSQSNETRQTFTLTSGGIAGVTTQPAVPQDVPSVAVAGAPIKTPVTDSPALWWKFDDGLAALPVAGKYAALESVNQVACTIAGTAAIWTEGVSGACLAFDGFTSAVTLPAANAPDVSGGLTVEAWVAPQEYSWNSAAIADHSAGDQAGYSLHIDHLGHVVLRVKTAAGWLSCASAGTLPLLRWAHVAGVYQPSSGLSVYINGVAAGNQPASGTLLDAANTQLWIGKSHKQQAPVATLGGYAASFLSDMVFDGLIDEVRIHGRALTSAQIAASRQAMMPANPQPLQYRVMPSGAPAAATFGASYAKLAYAPAWDNMWRVGDHPDIVVGFDEHPVRMVFWRGTVHSLATVSENGIWVSDQSPESGTAQGCCEHMSDKQCRYSHVRLIENTAARVVVHWRVASTTVNYQFNTPNDPWGEWTDEYYYIYPDAVAVRYQEIHANPPSSLFEVQQHELLNQPGTRPEDNTDYQMITVANMDGQTQRWTWQGGPNAVSMDPNIQNGSIEYINLKAQYKHFVIGEPGSSWGLLGWGSSYSSLNCWNHWPVGLLPSDGRNTTAPDRPSSSCVGTLSPARHNVAPYQQQVMNLYGLTTSPAADLAPLAKSWAQAPALAAIADCASSGYDTSQRAYQLNATGPAPTFSIAASPANPLVNLCLVVRNWNSSDAAQLEINAVAQASGPQFRKGIVRDTSGVPSLVVWVELQATAPITLVLRGKPLPPTGLVATAGRGVVVLNWTQPPGASDYTIASTNSVTGAVQIDRITAPPLTKIGLDVGTAYSFVVSAVNSLGESVPSDPVTATPTAVKGEQTIAFNAGTTLGKTLIDAPFAAAAMAASGLPVTYASDNAPVATVDGNSGTVAIKGLGTARILANQAGNDCFNAAPQAVQTLTVTKANQTLAFALGLMVSKMPAAAAFADSATASSGLPVTYASDNAQVATVDANGRVTIKGLGTAHILTNQAGDGTYNPAPQVSQTLLVAKIIATTTHSASHIVFDNTRTLVGAAVFGNAGTYDGIPFSLWPPPYSTAQALGSGVSVVASPAWNTITGLQGDGQYATVAYSSTNAAGSLTVSGLDSAKQYLFQVGFCDKRAGSYPYGVSAALTLSDGTTAATPLAFGAISTDDDYALLTVTVSGSTSLKLDLPQAASGVGPIIGGFAVHCFEAVGPPARAITALSTKSSNHIMFDNTQLLVGAAVFGNAGTYDGIPFSLWAAPYTTAKALGSAVSVVASPIWNSITQLGGDGQYATVAYASTNVAGSLTVSGLDSTKQYLFQIGFCDKRTNCPYDVSASLTLSDNTTASTPLAFGTSPTGDEYALLTVTVSGSTSLKLDLPMAATGVGPIIGGFALHQFQPAAGSYAAWAASHAGNQAAHLDYDNDGVANGVEFFMGEAGGFTATPAVVHTAGALVWTWPRDPAAAAAFMFQVSDVLSAWTDIAPPDPRIDATNPNQVTLTLPSSASSRFCRLVVRPAP